jgi:Holliday junction resolvase
MNHKAKGSNAERELIKMFWDAGYAAIRAAGSGSARHPSPDIIASNRIRRIAVECKSSRDLKKYLSTKDIEQLVEFAEKFGAEPWIGIRFDVLKWYFLSIDDLEKTPSGYVISIASAKSKGLLFEEFVEISIL